MELEITVIYCLCEDFLRTIGHHDDPQSEMSTAEVMTTTLVASHYFSGSHERSRKFLGEHGYLPRMLSKSQFSRRLYRIPESTWRCLLVSEAGVPVKFFLSPGSHFDTSVLYDFSFPLPQGSWVYGNKAYNVYKLEDELREGRNLHLMPVRKKNSTRPYESPSPKGSDASVSASNPHSVASSSPCQGTSMPSPPKALNSRCCSLSSLTAFMPHCCRS